MKYKNKVMLFIVFILMTFSAFSAIDKKKEKLAVPNIILNDQYGKQHNLQDYKGKIVFINFWTTWCSYCVEEIPYLEKISKEYSEDLVVLGIAAPKSKEYSKNPDVSKDKILEFLISDTSCATNTRLIFKCIFFHTFCVYLRRRSYKNMIICRDLF